VDPILFQNYPPLFQILRFTSLIPHAHVHHILLILLTSIIIFSSHEDIM
jgi:hypothetical protein